MVDPAEARSVRRDVAIAMARTVVEKTGFSQRNYTEDIVPSEDPLDGFGASLAFWGYILGLVEARLERMNSAYSVFDVTENFARRSRTSSLRSTNDKIASIIVQKLDSFDSGGSDND